ncbi:MAG: DUF2793 domain-containing protein [Halothiobacillaceae bacterium]
MTPLRDHEGAVGVHSDTVTHQKSAENESWIGAVGPIIGAGSRTTGADGMNSGTKSTRADLLAALRDGIAKSVAGDLTRRDCMRDAKALLAEAGWWGTKTVIGPDGVARQTRFTPARLKLIFDVNTRMAYAAGRWDRIQAAKVSHPYLRYVARADERVRASHRPWHNVTLPVDDPWWQTHYPPNGWRCRCRAVPMRQAEYQTRTDLQHTPPDEPDVEWQNPKTGEVVTVPARIDPGFGYNVGEAARWRIKHGAHRDRGQPHRRERHIHQPAKAGHYCWPHRLRAQLRQILRRYLMPSIDPNLGLTYGWTLGESGWNTSMDANLKRLGAVVGLSVKDWDLATPPASPVDGDRYIIPAAAAGAWAGKTNQIAVRIAGAWEYYVPKIGWLCYIEDKSVLTVFKASGWSTGIAI